MAEEFFQSLSGLASCLVDDGIIQFVNQLLTHAKRQGASDIHLEPYENCCRIRYRQDGLLYEIAEIKTHLASRVLTRLKVMAKLDTSERRLPQDGHFNLATAGEQLLDIRISSCPTVHGEKIVLRLLDCSKMTLDLDALGFELRQKTLFLKKLSQPQGLILVTGPTGSGKTVTLYSALDYLNTTEKNILTVEDPVEMKVQGINQVAINAKTGLDFATALRAFLRQDPDIMMVGEMRDKETANIALQAAQTGHLVLSTLHTNSAAETLLRLISIGLAPEQLTQALKLVIAQRLVRKLCRHCKAAGCEHCRQGYSGRTGIFECLPITEKLIPFLWKKARVEALVKAAEAEGFMTLRAAGLEKVRQGLTSLAELDRVLLT